MGLRAAASGKELGELVAAIEGLLLQPGFTVTKNPWVYNDQGVQVAQFDVEIRGRLGPAEIAWFLECRNRPREGPAPGAWIEQFVGRRSRLNFNKLTAVSTTGFAQGAIQYAAQVGIDVRAVEQIAPEMAAWLGLRFVTGCERCHHLRHASFVIAPEVVLGRMDTPKNWTRKVDTMINRGAVGTDAEVNQVQCVSEPEFRFCRRPVSSFLAVAF